MNYYKNHCKLNGLYSLRGHIEDDRDHYNGKIKQTYKELYDINVSLREMPSIGCYGFQKWSSEMVKFKHEKLNLPLGHKMHVKIPNIFMNKFPESLIRGIFDTDGNLYLENKNRKLYPRISISGISKDLIHQIYKILNRLDLKPTITVNKYKHKNWNDLYRVNLRGELMFDKWFKTIGSSNQKNIKKYHYFIDSS